MCEETHLGGLPGLELHVFGEHPPDALEIEHGSPHTINSSAGGYPGAPGRRFESGILGALPEQQAEVGPEVGPEPRGHAGRLGRLLLIPS